MRALRAKLAGLLGRPSRRACQDYVDIGSVVADPVGNGESAGARFQLDIRQNDIDRNIQLLEHSQSFATAYSFDYTITAVTEISGNRHTNENVVLDDDDCGIYLFYLKLGHPKLTSFFIGLFRTRQ